MRKTLIVAHRGASNLARENTIASFEKAIDIGVDMIEFDVRRSRDQTLIVHHDELVGGKPIKTLTYDEISEGAKTQGFSIPTVEEVLQHTSGRVDLDVEIKEEGYEEEVVEILHRHLKTDRFLITSFHDLCVKRIKDNHPDVRTGLILGISKPPHPIRTRISEFFPARRCRETEPDILVPHWKLVRTGFLHRAKKEKRPVFVWTVNDQRRIWKMLHDERIEGIITDKPDVALSLRKKMDAS